MCVGKLCALIHRVLFDWYIRSVDGFDSCIRFNRAMSLEATKIFTSNVPLFALLKDNHQSSSDDSGQQDTGSEAGCGRDAKSNILAKIAGAFGLRATDGKSVVGASRVCITARGNDVIQVSELGRCSIDDFGGIHKQLGPNLVASPRRQENARVWLHEEASQIQITVRVAAQEGGFF